MKGDNTLLVEKETSTETTKKVETANLEKKEKEITKKLFSSKPDEEKVVERPNFDKIEELPPEKRRKIFKISKTTEVKPKHKLNKKLKVIILSFVFVLLGAFTITTSIDIAKSSAELADLKSGYNASLTDLIKKIYSTETGNRSLDMFETFPEEDLSASSIYESSNWFDRVCNFLTGLFGG